MNIRCLNSPSSAPVLIQPPNNFAVNSSTNYQDVPEHTAKLMVSAGFVPVAFVGTTSQRPANIRANNSLNLSVFVDTSLGKTLAQDSTGTWRDITNGNAA